MPTALCDVVRSCFTLIIDTPLTTYYCVALIVIM